MLSPRTFLRGCKFLAGAVAVHFVMAACSGSSGSADKGSKNSKSGSDDDDDDDPTRSASADDSKSGSRLKVRRVSTKDGATGTIGFYDSKLKVNCYFGKSDDGKMHCQPFGVDLAYVQEQYYSDAACTKHVALATAGCTPKYGYQSSETCDGAVTLFALGSPVTQYYTKNGAACGPTPQQVSAGQIAFVADDALDPDTFVLGDEETE